MKQILLPLFLLIATVPASAQFYLPSQGLPPTLFYLPGQDQQSTQSPVISSISTVATIDSSRSCSYEKYDPNGLLVESSDNYPCDTLLRRGFYTYDHHGQPASVLVLGPDGDTLRHIRYVNHYDSLGYLIQEDRIISRDTFTLSFRYALSADSLVRESFMGSTLIVREVYEPGRRRFCTYCNPQEGRFTALTIALPGKLPPARRLKRYRFVNLVQVDEQGQPVAEYSLFEGRWQLLSKYAYRYDPYGNWTYRSSDTRQVERSIEYYK